MQFLYATVTMAFLRICCLGCVEFGSTSIAALFRPAREKSSRESKSCGLRQPGGEKIQAWHYQKVLEDKNIWCGGNSKRKKRSDYLPILPCSSPRLAMGNIFWVLMFSHLSGLPPSSKNHSKICEFRSLYLPVFFRIAWVFFSATTEMKRSKHPQEAP